MDIKDKKQAADSRGGRRRKNAAASEGDQITDPRFASIQTSALYRLPSKRNTHVALDPRFAHMLRDQRFTTHAKVDRYGRRIQSQKGKKELERLYRVTKPLASTSEDRHDSLDEDQQLDDNDDDDDVQAELARVSGKAYDPARDGGFSESSSDESSGDEAAEDAGAEDQEVEFLDPAAGDAPEGEVSTRLAIVNLDWDNIRAVDLFAVLSSFVPGNGRLERVAVYPSEYGKERMEREDIEGPPAEIFTKSTSSANLGASTGKAAAEDGDESEDSSEEEEEDEAEAEDDEEADERIKKSLVQEDEGEEFNSSQLRRYQIDRLRYYYAVVTCPSAEIAKEIYDAVDGAEYLSSANFFDLRFIPDEMDFSEDTPRDECTSIPDRYEPKDFVTDALQHSKVKLSWDAEDTRRKEVQKQAFSGSRAAIEENDLKAYLASDSSDEDEEEGQEAGNGEQSEKLTKKEQERQRMRRLLGLADEPTSRGSAATNKDKEPVGDMQVTFTSGLTGENGSSTSSDEDAGEETTIEKYARKEKERKAQRKEAMQARFQGHVPERNAPPGAEEKDLGFDDPFFAAPAETARASASAARKQAKAKQRSERKEEDTRAAAQREQLEALVTDEAIGDKGMAHFDMQDIEQGEKALRKKKLHKKLSAKKQQAIEAKQSDGFAVDVQDPRFAAIYQRNEFAVDPSHPRFKGTDGMNALLEEHRRKRRRGGEGEGDGPRQEGNGSASASGKNKGDDARRLLERIKSKSRKVG